MSDVLIHISFIELAFILMSIVFIISDEAQVCRDPTEQPILTLRDINTVFVYVQTWPAR